MRKSKEKNMQPEGKGIINFQKKIKRIRSPSNFNLKLSSPGERLVVPRTKIKTSEHKLYQTDIRSLNVSRHLIEEEEEKPFNLQFSKKIKITNRNHGRTQSNQVRNNDSFEEQLSNFSNSLENISQEVIQIPFAKTKITPNNKENLRQSRNFKGLEFSRKNCSLQSKRTQKCRQSSTEMLRQRKNNSKLSQQNQKIQRKEFSYQGGLNFIPKSRKNTANRISKQSIISISQFTLRALKITQNGSIVYFALHKQTNSIYALKSIRKASIKGKQEQLLLQIKLGLAFGHPNYTKIYGVFSDKDNLYLIREYLEEGSIYDHKKYITQSRISLTLNHVLFAASCLSNVIQMKYWTIDPEKIAKTHGIAKITSLSLDLTGKRDLTENLKPIIEWFFQSQDRRSTFEGSDSLYSKGNQYSLVGKQSLSFLQALDKLFYINPASIMILLQHPFLRESRFKATMQQ